jgi:1,4-dihydroxy-2-naphthoate polyprenyltransferase
VTRLADWVQGARPRTLPAAIAPVVAGTGAAAEADSVVWTRALLSLVVSLALQVGVNYANDYSDGVRGTDTGRVGPVRLVGSGLAAPRTVLAAAVAAFAVAAVAGLLLAALTTWWLLLVGGLAIVAAWTYTGGPNPYGYRALGELSVFVFFGLVAVLGTTYVQVGQITWPALGAGIGVGAFACAILVANNLRDVPTDAVAGKRTLAVVLGDARTRVLYVGLIALGYAVVLALGAVLPWTLLALLSVPLAARPVALVRRGVSGTALIPVLRDTGRLELAYAVVLAIGLAI